MTSANSQSSYDLLYNNIVSNDITYYYITFCTLIYNSFVMTHDIISFLDPGTLGRAEVSARRSASCELWYSYPCSCPNKFYKLPAILFLLYTFLLQTVLGMRHGYECHSSSYVRRRAVRTRTGTASSMRGSSGRPGIGVAVHSYMHTFIHSYHIFIHSYIHSYIHTFIHTFIRSHILGLAYGRCQHQIPACCRHRPDLGGRRMCSGRVSRFIKGGCSGNRV